MTSLTVALMAVTSSSASRSDVAVGNDNDGAVGMVGDLGADRAQQQPLEPARAAGADDDHVRAGGRAEEFLGGQPVDGPDGDRRRPGPLVGLFKHAVGLLLSRFEYPLG